jgi:hypothetical protein
MNFLLFVTETGDTVYINKTRIDAVTVDRHSPNHVIVSVGGDPHPYRIPGSLEAILKRIETESE